MGQKVNKIQLIFTGYTCARVTASKTTKPPCYTVTRVTVTRAWCHGNTAVTMATGLLSKTLTYLSRARLPHIALENVYFYTSRVLLYILCTWKIANLKASM